MLGSGFGDFRTAMMHPLFLAGAGMMTGGAPGMSSGFTAGVTGLHERNTDERERQKLRMLGETHDLNITNALGSMMAHMQRPEQHAAILKLLTDRGHMVPAALQDYGTARSAASAMAAPAVADLALKRAQLAQSRTMTPDGRAALAARFGIGRSDPRYVPFVLTGQIPAKGNTLLDFMTDAGAPPPAAATVAAAPVPAVDYGPSSPGASSAIARSVGAQPLPGVTIDSGSAGIPMPAPSPAVPDTRAPSPMDYFPRGASAPEPPAPTLAMPAPQPAAMPSLSQTDQIIARLNPFGRQLFARLSPSERPVALATLMADQKEFVKYLAADDKSPPGYRRTDGGDLSIIPGGPAARSSEDQLRREFITQTKTFQDVRDAYARVQTVAKAEPSAAGDMALIFSFMKMLDPGSVVREGEFATAQNAAGVPERVQNLWNRLLRGERLNPTQREDFTTQARRLFEAQHRSHAVMSRSFRDTATRMGLNPDSVVLDLGEGAVPGSTAPAAPAPGAATPGSAPAPASPNRSPAAPTGIDGRWGRLAPNLRVEAIQRVILDPSGKEAFAKAFGPEAMAELERALAARNAMGPFFNMIGR